MSAAAETEDVVLDDEAKQLKLTQTKEEARQAIAEARRKTLAALLPTADVKPIEGATEVGERVGLVADLLARSLLDNAAVRIAEDVVTHLGDQATVLLVESRLLTRIDWIYEVVRNQLAAHKDALDRATTKLKETMPKPDASDAAPLGALPLLFAAVPAVVSGLATLFGMFKSDYSIKSREVTIGTTPLIAAVARALIEKKRGVTVSGFEILRESETMETFWTVLQTRDELERLRVMLHGSYVAPYVSTVQTAGAQVKAAAAALDKALVEGKDDAVVGNLRDRVTSLRQELENMEKEVAPKQALVAFADAVLARFDAFASALLTVPKDEAYPPLVAAAIQARLHAADSGVSHVLFVTVEGAGGETVTRRGPFRKGNEVGFIGGAQVSHLLLALDSGRTVAAGAQPMLAHAGYDLDQGGLVIGTGGRIEWEEEVADHRGAWRNRWGRNR